MAEENPLLAEVSRRSGLPVTGIAPSNNPLLQEAQQRSGKIITPDARRHYDFSGLDAAASQVNLTNTYTDPLESYTSYGVPRNAFIDWNETRAENQSTVQKWANGLTKAGITALGAVTENTVGVVGGLLNLAFGENHSYYDNPVGRTIDEVNEWAQQAMPNYYTKREEEMGVLEGMTTANFWADKFANGAGYTLGSLATMWTGVGEGALVAKMAGMGRMAKIAKAADKVMDTTQNAAKFGSKQFQAYNAAKAMKAPYSPNFAKGIDDGLEAMAKRANINTAAKQLSVGMHMSLAESSVEAREAKNKFIEEQTAIWEEANPGQEMSADIEDGIISSANAVGNLTFGINLPLLTLTNMVSFSKMLRGGKPTAEALTYDVKKVGTQWVEALPEKGMARAFAKSNRIFGAPIKNAVSEGAQEAGQFITASTAGDYYSDKFADGTGDMAEAFVNGLSKSIGTKEGLESILIGALVGGGSGTLSILGGADKKFAKQKDANTKKTLEIMNSEAFGKVLENMEQSQKNLGLVDAMNKATEKGDFKNAEILRRRLISSVADQYRKSGALDYAMQQMDDLKQLNEEEFKKRWGYDANKTLKEQTGMEQSEIIDDVKNKMERSVKRQEQVQAIVRAQNPSMGMFSRILDSFDTEEIRNSKAVEKSIRNMYANTLLYRLEDVDNHDDLIKQTYKELHELAPSLSEIPEEDFEFMVKTGKINIDDKGEVTVSSTTTNTLNPKLADKLNEIFKSKAVLNPEDAIQFAAKAKELGGLIRDRESAIQSYQGLRNKPEDIALLVEAEVERRKQDDKYKNKQQAQAAVANAQSVEELDKAFPKNADPEDIAAAMAKREELIEQEEAIMATYEAMSKDEFDAIDSESLPPLEESAYNRVRRKKEDEEAERRASKTIGVSAPDPNAPAEATISYEEVLSDIEARTFGEIMVSFDGNSVTINGRAYSNLKDNPLEALIRDEQGVVVGVTMTDMATGNEITWKVTDPANSSNPEIVEKENAIAEGLAYMTMLRAVAIRPDQSIPLSEAREELSPRIQAIKEDAEVRRGFEENAETTEDERELAKNNLSKTAGLTDDQLRAQIETLKSDLEEINDVLYLQKLIAEEARFTMKEFYEDPEVKSMVDEKRNTIKLLLNKIKALRDRKQTARQEALDTTNTSAEVENALSPSEEDLIKAGIEEELRKLEDDKVPLLKSLKTSEDILNGKYDAAEDPEAAKEIRRSTIRQTIKQVKKKIAVIDSKINKRKNLINKLNEERELEKLRQDRDAAEGAGITTEGQEPEGKDITPREGAPTEGLDGILSEEQVKALKEQREEAERLRKLEEEKKKVQTPTPQPIVVKQPVTVTTSGELDVRLAKGEKTIINGKILVSEEGESLPADMIQQTVSGVPIIVNPALASNPFIAQEGTEVRFEVKEDTDWWLSQTPAPGEEWKTVPIYMVVKDQDGVEQRVALLQSTTETSGQMRKDIYELHKKGLTPVAMSAGKVYDSTNYSNATLADGTKFFYPASTLVNKGETPAIVIVGIQDFQKSFKVSTPGDTNFPNLIDTAFSFDATNLALGQVGVVVMDPNGAPRVVIASTRDMTEAGRTAALSMIEAEEPSLNQFAQIVGTNLLLNDSVDPTAGEQVYTEINEEMVREYSESAKTFMLVETLANGTELITFFSPSANSLVRMNAVNMKVALAGATPIFSFVEVGTNAKGHTALVTAKKDDAVRKGVESNLANEFKAAIMTKKFQVDKNMLSSKETYTSPISGQVYDSYFEYLTSENEVPEERTEGKGTKAILGVDTEVNSQKSPFFDVGIKTTNLGTREGDVTTERELAAKQVVMPTDNKPTSYPITETPSTPVSDTITQSDIEQYGEITYNTITKRLTTSFPRVDEKGKGFRGLVYEKDGIFYFEQKEGDIPLSPEDTELFKKYFKVVKYLGIKFDNMLKEIATKNNISTKEAFSKIIDAPKEEYTRFSKYGFTEEEIKVMQKFNGLHGSDGYLANLSNDLWSEYAYSLKFGDAPLQDKLASTKGNTYNETFQYSDFYKIIKDAEIAALENKQAEPTTDTKATVTPSSVANIEETIKEIIANKDFIELVEVSINESYYINRKTGKTYKRVSDIISDEKPDPNDPLVQSALTIGKKVDILVRDFFSGQLKDLSSYDLSDEETVKQFLTQLEGVKSNLEKRGETVLANDIVLYNDELGIAGTVDLLTYDKAGNIRIYDMKSMRGDNFKDSYKGDALNKYESTRYGKSKKQKHTEQISLYRILLNNTHGLLAKTIGVMPLEISYNAGDTTTTKLNLLKGVQLVALDKVENAELAALEGAKPTAPAASPISAEVKALQDLRDARLGAMGFNWSNGYDAIVPGAEILQADTLEELTDKINAEYEKSLAALEQPAAKSTADEFGFSNLGNIGNQGLAIMEADLIKNGIHIMYTKGATEAQLAKIENDIKLLQSKYNVRVVRGTSGRGPRIDIKVAPQIGVTHTLKNQQVSVDHPEGETSVPIIDYQSSSAESYEGTKIKVTATTANTVTAEITYPDGESFTDTFDKKDFEVKVIVLPSAPQVPATVQPTSTVSDEEKVVEITGAEDTSGIFELLGAPIADVKPAPVSIWPSAEEIKAAGLGNPYDSLGITPEDLGSTEAFAAMAARNQAQAKNTENNC